MSIQSEAALRGGAERRSRKTQIAATSKSVGTNIQIGSADAPAVGALAPLVMPVPNLESANTLSQAMNAVEQFGSTVEATGRFVKLSKELTHLDLMKQGNEAYDIWSTSFEKSKLNKNFAANFRTATRDEPTQASFIDGHVRSVVGNMPDGIERRHFEGLVANRVAGEMAPFVAEKNKQYLAGQYSAFSQSFTLNNANGSSPEQRMKVLDAVANDVFERSSLGTYDSIDDVKDKMLAYAVAENTEPGAALAFDPSTWTDNKELQTRLRIQNQEQQNKIAASEKSRIEAAVEAIGKESATASPQVVLDKYISAGVPIDSAVGSTMMLLKGAGRAALISTVGGHIAKFAPDHALVTQYNLMLDAGYEEEAEKWTDQLANEILANGGDTNHPDVANKIQSALSLYKNDLRPGQQVPGAMSLLAVTKLVESDMFGKLKGRRAANEKAARVLAGYEAATNDNTAGVAMGDLVATPHIQRIPPARSRELLRAAEDGDQNAMIMLARVSESGKTLDIDAETLPQHVYMASQINSGRFQFLVNRTDGTINNKTFELFKESLEYIKSSPEAPARIYSEQLKVLEKIESFNSSSNPEVFTETMLTSAIDTAMRAVPIDVAVFPNSAYRDDMMPWGDESPEEAGFGIAAGNLNDEVRLEVLNQLASDPRGARAINNDALGVIIGNAMQTVANNYTIIRAGGKARNIVLTSKIGLDDPDGISRAAQAYMDQFKINPEDNIIVYPFGVQAGSEGAEDDVVFSIRHESADGEVKYGYFTAREPTQTINPWDDEKKRKSLGEQPAVAEAREVAKAVSDVPLESGGITAENGTISSPMPDAFKKKHDAALKIMESPAMRMFFKNMSPNFEVVKKQLTRAIEEAAPASSLLIDANTKDEYMKQVLMSSQPGRDISTLEPGEWRYQTKAVNSILARKRDAVSEVIKLSLYKMMGDANGEGDLLERVIKNLKAERNKKDPFGMSPSGQFDAPSGGQFDAEKFNTFKVPN